MKLFAQLSGVWNVILQDFKKAINAIFDSRIINKYLDKKSENVT